MMGEAALVSFIEEVLGKNASEINQLNQYNITISAQQYKKWLNKNASRFIGYLIGNEGLEAEVEIDVNFP